MERKHFNPGYLYAIATGVLGGFVPIVFKKSLIQEPIPNATALFIKLAASLLILVPIAIPQIKKSQLSKDLAWKIPICSFLYIATLVCLYESYNHVPAGIGISLHYTFPLFTLGISIIFFRFRATVKTVLTALLSLVGVTLLSSGVLSDGGAPIGIAFAIGSALAYSCYFLWIERCGLASMNTTLFVALKTVGAVVFLFFYLLLTDQISFSISLTSFCGLMLSSAFTIISSFCLTLAIRHIGSVRTSILGSIEPIVCAIAGFLFLGEAIGVKSGIGIATVLVATVLVTLNKGKKD